MNLFPTFKRLYYLNIPFEEFTQTCDLNTHLEEISFFSDPIVFYSKQGTLIVCYQVNKGGYDSYGELYYSKDKNQPMLKVHYKKPNFLFICCIAMAILVTFGVVTLPVKQAVTTLLEILLGLVLVYALLLGIHFANTQILESFIIDKFKLIQVNPIKWEFGKVWNTNKP